MGKNKIMKFLFVIAIAFIASCSSEPPYCTEITEIGACTEGLFAKCAVKLANGKTILVLAPSMVGMRVCWERTGWYYE